MSIVKRYGPARYVVEPNGQGDESVSAMVELAATLSLELPPRFEAHVMPDGWERHRATAECECRPVADELARGVFVHGKGTAPVHVIPHFPGERDHEETIACWCGPQRDLQEPNLIVHERRAEA